MNNGCSLRHSVHGHTNEIFTSAAVEYMCIVRGNIVGVRLYEKRKEKKKV